MADIKVQIQAQMKKFQEAMSAKNHDEVLKFYTDSCRILPPGAPMVVGKEAFKAFLGAMAQFMVKIGKNENTVVDVVSMGELATCVNTDISYGKDGKVLDNSKSITLWKKVGGNWHIHWSAWSSDKPTPPQ